MVDRQTPTVQSDEETAREAEATREAEARLDADQEESVRRTIDRELSPDEATGRDAAAGRAAADDQAAAGRHAPGAASQPTSGAAEAALFDADSTRDFHERWLTIQTRFVDEPGKAVEQAQALVAEVVQQLTESFDRQRRDFEARWSGNDDVSTEDLRQAIRRYRSFFNRLLSV